ncbi:MAG: HAMP domain-containing sensor histidine kinase, partial [Pseudomonadota bacterium]
DGMSRDVVRATERERAARERAEAANTAKTDFVARASHELRTPLSSVIGFAELIESDKIDDPKEKIEYAKEIKASGRRLLQIVNDMIGLSTAQGSNDEVFDLRAAIDHVAKGAAEAMQSTDVTFEIDFAADVHAFRGDERSIRRALDNLIANAVKHAPGGRIIVAARLDGREFTLSVSDDGEGVAPADIASVFEPFFQSGAVLSRRHEGVGLGLAIVKAIVEAHDGLIEIASDLGAGATIAARFPIDRHVPRADDVHAAAA